ncbi:unnamed protein product (macronuclear) [Paramecium tetraurelia]|uniref:Uncharacterized protein n=1 Tax=Paramecium tetraurelia TaxID=5888 RepID=A0CCC6_PARTE|nr:uncharacterized protein GSPATT00037228001 [Paramecium tetraurelia]CAK68443.1 unnamed protein product [Paramecium tetraurelia]|eukprot:XP_001435840.1 hypothetical protein (macronuclear) [Paramecium tetraurelia strain d4-2]
METGNQQRKDKRNNIVTSLIQISQENCLSFYQINLQEYESTDTEYFKNIFRSELQSHLLKLIELDQQQKHFGKQCEEKKFLNFRAICGKCVSDNELEVQESENQVQTYLSVLLFQFLGGLKFQVKRRYLDIRQVGFEFEWSNIECL